MTEKELAQFLGGRLYRVGGSVRDQLLGRTASDRDFVLTGVRVEDVPLDKIAGQSFPVFRTKLEGETVEIALARKEKKHGQGYHGFEIYSDPTLTIEEDLIRRDLTINAMAIDVMTEELIDPYGGRKDLKDRILRHTSDAFSEDPLRVYRVARFAAKLGFRIAPETKALMMRLKPELTELTPERVYIEFAKALMTPFPDRFFRELDGLLDVHFPEIEKLKVPDRHDGTAFEHTMACLYRGHTLMERFGLLVHDLGKGLSPDPPKHHGHQEHEHLVQSLGDRLRIPSALIKFGRITMRMHMKLKDLHKIRPGKIIRMVDSSTYKQLRLSYLESSGRYDKKLYLKHVKLVKDVIKLKKDIGGKILLDRGITPDALFGAKLLQERIKEFKIRRLLDGF